MQAAVFLIPDQRPFLPAQWRLADLQKAMKYTDFQFGTFKNFIRDNAVQFGIDIQKSHSKQDQEKWNSFVIWVVEKNQNLNRKRAPGAVIKPPPMRRYIGKKPPPLRCSAIPALRTDRYAYEELYQPCLVCRETPALVSHRLNELLQQEEISKGELVKLGVRSDLDLDTLLLLGSDEIEDLFCSSSMTNMEKFSLKDAFQSLKPMVRLERGITETSLRTFIAKVYTCRKHCALPPHTHIPPQLLKLFNELHIEHLIPAAILLGIKSDSHVRKVSTYNDTKLESMICQQSDFVSLSPLQKVVLRWAFGMASN
ncbi:hypothetical protein LENED_002787 [Lentinula edodes]|uniref:Uncharacterized protein n=1 Tax=Lentinula edodes TaxID=5353 RepID=A0A1Q3E211_LENED|nr:hypothetical protein LENED_002787 [Lentinula edodes]